MLRGAKEFTPRGTLHLCRIEPRREGLPTTGGEVLLLKLKMSTSLLHPVEISSRKLVIGPGVEFTPPREQQSLT